MSASENGQRRRIPRGPVLLILAILLMLGWLAWLVRQPPRPLPEVPPHKAIPPDLPHPQDPRLRPAPGDGPAQNPQ
ncbi:MAG: hypothetical protein AB1697_10350 [Pseudomonadota bacterium]